MGEGVQDKGRGSEGEKGKTERRKQTASKQVGKNALERLYGPKALHGATHAKPQEPLKGIVRARYEQTLHGREGNGPPRRAWVGPRTSGRKY